MEGYNLNKKKYDKIQFIYFIFLINQEDSMLHRWLWLKLIAWSQQFMWEKAGVFIDLNILFEAIYGRFF